MKRQKRDRGDRAYARGYQAGLEGRSRDTCPFAETNLRQTWLSGWRTAREAGWEASAHLEFRQTG